METNPKNRPAAPARQLTVSFIEEYVADYIREQLTDAYQERRADEDALIALSESIKADVQAGLAKGILAFYRENFYTID